jgi:hypothetical protein
MASNWQDVRARAGLNEDNIVGHRERMTAEVRAARLADVRTRHDLSQTQVRIVPTSATKTHCGLTHDHPATGAG